MPLWRGGFARRYANVRDNGRRSERSRSPRREQPSSSSDGLRDVVSELFLSNRVSGKDANRLCKGATKSGAGDVVDLGKGTKAGNFCRDLRRRLTKDSEVPAPYWFWVPTFNKKTQTSQDALVPCILPHELFQTILSRSPESFASVFPSETHGEHVLGQVREVEKKWRLSPGTLVPIGLWGDGTPMASKMRDTHEALSWNFCALPHGRRHFFFGLPRSMFHDRRTWDAVFSVWAWSMRQLAVGKFPAQRHDGTPWRKSDKARQSCAGEDLAARAVHIQCRGDWDFFSSVWSFPRWQATRMCWRCAATQNGETSFRRCGLDAPWRAQRLSSSEFIQWQRSQGITPSKIWSTPGLAVHHVQPDFLHTVDLGVGADCIGNLFWELIEGVLPQPTKAERLQELWHRIRMY